MNKATAIERCRHRRSWLVTFGNAGGIEWCYECGAFRPLDALPAPGNGVTPCGKWTRPTGIGGENPALKKRKEKK